MRILLLVVTVLVVECTIFPSVGDEEKEFGRLFLKELTGSEELVQEIGHVSATTPICTVCHIAMRGLQKIPHRSVLELLTAIGTNICVRKKIEDRIVCKGAVSEMINYIFVNAWAHYFDPHLACHKIHVNNFSLSSVQRSTKY